VADLQSAAEPSHPHLHRFLMVGLVLLAVQAAGLLVVVLYCQIQQGVGQQHWRKLALKVVVGLLAVVLEGQQHWQKLAVKVVVDLLAVVPACQLRLRVGQQHWQKPAVKVVVGLLAVVPDCQLRLRVGQQHWQKLAVKVVVG